MKLNYTQAIIRLFEENNIKYGRYAIIDVDLNKVAAIASYSENSLEIKFVYEYCNRLQMEEVYIGLLYDTYHLEEYKQQYYYFTDDMNIHSKYDYEDTTDKYNKENHNYFLAKDFSSNSLRKQMQNHIKDMRLNLLANFYPKFDDDLE